MTWQQPCHQPRQTTWQLQAFTDCILQATAVSNQPSGGSLYGYGLYGYGLYGYGSGGPQPGGVQGQCQIGPQVPHTWWNVGAVYIATASVNLSTFYLYRNIVSAGTLVGSSLNGNSDTVIPATPPLTAGEVLIGLWVGGDAGVQASMYLTGTIQQTSVATGITA